MIQCQKRAFLLQRRSNPHLCLSATLSLWMPLLCFVLYYNYWDDLKINVRILFSKVCLSLHVRVGFLSVGSLVTSMLARRQTGALCRMKPVSRTIGSQDRLQTALPWGFTERCRHSFLCPSLDFLHTYWWRFDQKIQIWNCHSTKPIDFMNDSQFKWFNKQNIPLQVKKWTDNDLKTQRTTKNFERPSWSLESTLKRL